MNPESDNSLVFNARCAFLFPKGRRCRLPAAPHSLPYCPEHAPFAAQNPDTIDFSSALLGKLRDLQSPEDLRHVLGRIFLLTAQGRLTTKRAAVLTYNLQQQLHALTAIDRRERAAQDREPEIIFDLPRPKRDDPVPNPIPGQVQEPVLTPATALELFRSRST